MLILCQTVFLITMFSKTDARFVIFVREISCCWYLLTVIRLPQSSKAKPCFKQCLLWHGYAYPTWFTWVEKYKRINRITSHALCFPKLYCLYLNDNQSSSSHSCRTTVFDIFKLCYYLLDYPRWLRHLMFQTVVVSDLGKRSLVGLM